ncbi:MAG: sialate O-acetylesterase, partial [Dysgonamonadaceae bacterium]|nr:sialate O-acetylesterase [Dysgonamonadaceae bacterium]
MVETWHATSLLNDDHSTLNDDHSALSDDRSAASETRKMLIILLAGQSNMAGRGAYSQLSPADTVTYSNILSLNKDNVWVRAKHPLHWDKSEAAVGMGISFARELIKKTGEDVTIGLVPCAAGGTNIDQWLNDAWFAYTGNFNLYTNFIERANKAAESGEIIAMLWHQGEANAGSTAYTTYGEKLLTLFTRMRNDLNLPDMPIISGELGRYLSYTYLNEVNVIINKLSDVLPKYAVASSAGLIPNSDIVHFTATSQVELGRRYAEAFYPVYRNLPASLTSLVYGSGTLSPAFNPDITEYTCYLPAGINSVTPAYTTSYTGA